MDNPKNPKSVNQWSTFDGDVLARVESLSEESQYNSKVLFPPLVFPRSISSEVLCLQPFILDNTLQRVISASPDGLAIVPSREARCIGDPDFIIKRGGNIDAVIEVKGCWVIPDNTALVSVYNSQVALNGAYHIRSAIVQTNTYMRLNKCRYAVITTSDFTYFLMRDNEGDLFISETYKYDSQSPTVLQCYDFLCSKTDGHGLSSPVSSPEKKTHSTRMQTSSGNATSSTVHVSADDNKGDVEDGEACMDESDGSVVDVNKFQLSRRLGEGRCVVYEELTYGCALKLVDASKHPDIGREVRQEAAVYKKLVALQGSYIPRLMWNGSWEGIFEGIAVIPVGTHSSALSREQQDHLVSALAAIHREGILHNDLSKSNIIVDGDGKPFIIDFGFAEECDSKARLEAEMQQFRKCMYE